MLIGLFLTAAGAIFKMPPETAPKDVTCLMLLCGVLLFVSGFMASFGEKILKVIFDKLLSR
ncbi:MAG: hypothetical protein PHP21_00890 [Patescibacteria group bacterium]|nr:hypothetical protein [Patescibacteria group bacterium]